MRKLLLCSVLFYSSIVLGRNPPKGELLWNMQRQTTQFAPDFMITQNMIGAGTVTISTPGTYALAENVTSSATTAISITASNVTLDLNGHTLTGAGANGTNIGINLSGGNANVTIQNGTITSCNCITITQSSNVIIDSVRCVVGATSANTRGIDLSNGTVFLIENVQVVGGEFGIQNQVGSPALSLINCTVLQAGTGFRIFPEFVAGCVAENCSSDGFSIPSSAAMIKSCNSMFNGGNGFTISGAQSTLFNCVAEGNTSGSGFQFGSNGINARNCISQSNGVDGFNVQNDTCVLSTCIASNNTNNGFTCAFPNAVFNGCISKNNGARGFNITANGTGSTLLNCSINGNPTDGITNAASGIDVNTCISKSNTGTASTNGITNTGADCAIRFCTTHNNQNVGISNTGSNTLILNCDTYSNAQGVNDSTGAGNSKVLSCCVYNNPSGFVSSPALTAVGSGPILTANYWMNAIPAA